MPTDKVGVNELLGFWLVMLGKQGSSPQEEINNKLVPLRGDCNTIEIAPNSVEDPNGGIEFAEVGFDESLLFLKSDKETIISNVYPNPFSKEITVDISSREKQIINYTLLNMDGRILFKDKIQIEKESNSYTINLSKISQKGLLFLVLLDEYGNQFHHKIVKQ